jgi:hypothetical protein
MRVEYGARYCREQRSRVCAARVVTHVRDDDTCVSTKPGSCFFRDPSGGNWFLIHVRYFTTTAGIF